MIQRLTNNLRPLTRQAQALTSILRLRENLACRRSQYVYWYFSNMFSYKIHDLYVFLYLVIAWLAVVPINSDC